MLCVHDSYVTTERTVVYTPHLASSSTAGLLLCKNSKRCAASLEYPSSLNIGCRKTHISVWDNWRSRVVLSSLRITFFDNYNKKRRNGRRELFAFLFRFVWMAFNLAETSATLTAAVSVAESKQTGLSHEEFLNEWNWCWIAQGKIIIFISIYLNLFIFLWLLFWDGIGNDRLPFTSTDTPRHLYYFLLNLEKKMGWWGVELGCV